MYQHSLLPPASWSGEVRSGEIWPPRKEVVSSHHCRGQALPKSFHWQLFARAAYWKPATLSIGALLFRQGFQRQRWWQGPNGFSRYPAGCLEQFIEAWYIDSEYNGSKLFCATIIILSCGKYFWFFRNSITLATVCLGLLVCNLPTCFSLCNSMFLLFVVSLNPFCPE